MKARLQLVVTKRIATQFGESAVVRHVTLPTAFGEPLHGGRGSKDDDIAFDLGDLDVALVTAEARERLRPGAVLNLTVEIEPQDGKQPGSASK